MKTQTGSDPLKDSINASFLEAPPAGFTSSVMNRLPPPALSSAYKPVITPFGWAVIAGVTLLLVLLGLFGDGSPSLVKLPQWPAIPVQAISFDALFSNSAVPLLMFIVLAGLFFVAADARIRRWKTA